MTIAERIQKLGFRRWYERALIECHAYLLTAILGMVLAFAAIELIGEHSDAGRLLLGIGAAILGTALVVFGLQRYHRLLMMAEGLGQKATCANCQTYGLFNVTAARADVDDSRATDEELGSIWLKVQCRKCGNQWTM